MKILAIDTSATSTSFSVLDENSSFDWMNRDDQKSRDASFELLQERLSEWQLSLSDFEALACCVGPGSFTGLRIGIGMAKTFAFALDLPVFGVNAPLAASRRRLWQDGPDRDIQIIVPGFRATNFLGRLRIQDGQPHQLGDIEHCEGEDELKAALDSNCEHYLNSSGYDFSLEGFSDLIPLDSTESMAMGCARAAQDLMKAGHEGHRDRVQPLYLKSFGIGPKAKTPEQLR